MVVFMEAALVRVRLVLEGVLPEGVLVVQEEDAAPLAAEEGADVEAGVVAEADVVEAAADAAAANSNPLPSFHPTINFRLTFFVLLVCMLPRVV
jgi:hypothetical protein